MNEEKVITYLQHQIMESWRTVMNYEQQLRDIGHDDIIEDCIVSAKYKIEIYTIILNKFEQ